jgi:5S rRNA maturation endonuclease (ribonuclease M5)
MNLPDKGSTMTKTAKKSKKATFTQRPAKRRIVKVYDYVNEKAELRHQTVRYIPKGFSQRRPNPDNPQDWIWDLKDTKTYLYHLPQWLSASKQDWQIIVEGEYDVETMEGLGFVATCNPMGAGKWKPDYNEYCKSRLIPIFCDRDEPGEKHGSNIARSIYEVAAKVRLIYMPPDFPKAKDVTELVEKYGWTAAQFIELIDKTLDYKPEETGSQISDQKAPRDLLMKLCGDINLFHDEYSNGYAVVPIGNHQETLSLKSTSFSDWLNRRFYLQYKDVPRKQELSDTIAALEGQAKFNAPQQTVAVRLAEHKGKIYLDIGDPDWRVIEIDASDWRIITNSQVTFKRPGGLAALIEPVHGGSIDLLKPFVNIKNKEDWTLLIGWILGAFQPVGPYPILSITGEQGSAKTIVCSLIQDLIDPSRAKLRSLPRSDHDLMLAATNNRLLAFDNVSTIPTWTSDALCRLSTWSAFSTRKLYSNDEETILSKQCPIMLNGIVEAANRSDLLDRMICITLKPILDKDRLTERVLFKNFEKDKPYILGAILDGISCALRNRDKQELPNPPRMADFAFWTVAGLTGLGLSPDDFLTAYASNRLTINQLALEGSILVEPLQNFIVPRLVWQGTASQLYDEINNNPKIEKLQTQKAWPKTPAHLGTQLRRLAPNLRRINIDIKFDLQTINKKRTRLMEIQFYPDDSVNLGKNDNEKES